MKSKIAIEEERQEALREMQEAAHARAEHEKAFRHHPLSQLLQKNPKPTLATATRLELALNRINN